MKKKSDHEDLERQLSALFGDPATADLTELDDVRDEVGGDLDLVRLAYDLALRSAQEYRLAGKPVPAHVRTALIQMKPSNTLEGAPTSRLNEIVESIMKPLRGPTTKLAFNYHRLTEKSERDERLLDQLGEEVKEDWSKEDE
jgi:hypothetical protein